MSGMDDVWCSSISGAGGGECLQKLQKYQNHSQKGKPFIMATFSSQMNDLYEIKCYQFFKGKNI